MYTFGLGGLEGYKITCMCAFFKGTLGLICNLRMISISPIFSIPFHFKKARNEYFQVQIDMIKSSACHMENLYDHQGREG
jgi:hypothetical protein